MRRIGAVLEVNRVGVAAIAVYRRCLEIIVHMARDAGQSDVHSSQRIAGVPQMVKLRPEPAVHGVAALTRGGEAKTFVVDHRRQKILLMAGETFGRQALEPPGRGVLVAIVTGHEGMRSDQWKAVLVIANCIQRDIPALHRVAALAIGAELTAMNVGVAIGAFGAYILKDHTGMALAATDLLVHPAQRIACSVVVKLGVGPDRFPTRVGVAVLTGNRQRAMRVGYLGLRAAHTWPRVLRWLLRRQTNHEWKQRNPQTKEPTSPVHLLLHVSFAALHAGPNPGAECVPRSANQCCLKCQFMNKLSQSGKSPLALEQTDHVSLPT